MVAAARLARLDHRLGLREVLVELLHAVAHRSDQSCGSSAPISLRASCTTASASSSAGDALARASTSTRPSDQMDVRSPARWRAGAIAPLDQLIELRRYDARRRQVRADVGKRLRRAPDRIRGEISGRIGSARPALRRCPARPRCRTPPAAPASRWRPRPRRRVPIRSSSAADTDPDDGGDHENAEHPQRHPQDSAGSEEAARGRRRHASGPAGGPAPDDQEREATDDDEPAGCEEQRSGIEVRHRSRQAGRSRCSVVVRSAGSVARRCSRAGTTTGAVVSGLTSTLQ